ncbi:MAG: hypothetical protein QF590_06325 [Dehalococcoidia bacterium]|nr:hypothetical protein [Dehalococcoidia bacterium]MDP7090897.1 hypothetical protein [Dehalococcoidia bacterium]MDP7485723.1 hypothetical protein [Dehalococcoidia bacterium]
MKIVVALAVFIGLATGVGFTVLQDNRDSSGSSGSRINTAQPAADPRKDLPVEVLKSLPDEELAEIFPEKAEAILVPESVKQFTSSGGQYDDPEYLRALLQKLGADPPADATTKQLQDMLAQLKGDDTTSSGK